jgi:hypothetical protein
MHIKALQSDMSKFQFSRHWTKILWEYIIDLRVPSQYNRNVACLEFQIVLQMNK